jgi:hypothetical protein
MRYVLRFKGKRNQKLSLISIFVILGRSLKKTGEEMVNCDIFEEYL